MSKQTEIKDKYWVDFLKYYKNIAKKYYYNGHGFVPKQVEDLFWEWLVDVKAEDAGTENFMAKL